MNEEFKRLKLLLERDRSIRRFKEKIAVDRNTIEKLVDLTRFCASGRNLQPLKYRIVVRDEERCAVFPLLKWAGYLADWDGPSAGERPAAYLIQCLDTKITSNCLCDDGLQIQAITLGATSLGLGACIIKSFNALEIKRVLKIDEWLEPLYVLALGYPEEKVIIEEMKDVSSFKYYREADGSHHVPKRQLPELII